MINQRKYSRRDMLGLSAGSLLALGLWPGALRAEGEGNSGDFSFIVVNDLHYVDDKCGKYFERVVAQMKAAPSKVDFCLIVGDYSDHGKPDELGAARDIFKTLGIPNYGVVGNHDYLTQEDRKAYEDLFPGRLNYFFEHERWQFLGLDTTEGQRGGSTKIQPPTLQWLDANLPKLDKKRPMIVFTHFPMGPLVPSRPLNADAFLERFKDYNLQAVFCGHFHASTERQIRSAVITTNKCCSFARGNHDGSKEKGYFACQAKDGKISRSFVEVKPA